MTHFLKKRALAFAASAGLAIAALGGCASTQAPSAAPVSAQSRQQQEQLGQIYKLSARFEDEGPNAGARPLTLRAYGMPQREQTAEGTILVISAKSPQVSATGGQALNVSLWVVSGANTPNQKSTGITDAVLPQGQAVKIAPKSGRAVWLTFDGVEP